MLRMLTLPLAALSPSSMLYQISLSLVAVVAVVVQPSMAMPPSFSMPAYSALFLENGGTSINEGNKIILPDSVLSSLVTSFGATQLPNPLVFKIVNKQIGRVSHCGVLEFTAQEDAAFLPDWMMENLLLSDGAPVELSLVELPRLTFVKMRPRQYSFTSIPNPKTMLEDILTRYTALTRGDTILARYQNEDYLLDITAVRPEFGNPPAGCIIETNLEVDFEPPLEEAPHIEEATVLQLDVPEQGHIAADQYKYYRVKIADPSLAVQISIESRSQDARPDLYVSGSVDKPTATQNQWSGGVQSPVVIQPTDSAFSSSWYYIAVHSYSVPGDFILNITQVQPKVVSGSPMLLSSGTALNGDDPNAVRCRNCNRFVPKASAVLHEITCTRNNWLCPKCQKVIRITDKDNHSHCDKCDAVFPISDTSKHHALFHQQVNCRCGAIVDAMALPDHQTKDCLFRLGSCKWCEEQIPMNQLLDHQPMCGAKTEPCVICNRPVARRQMDMHRAIEHGINPCIDSSGNRLTAENVAAAARARQVQEVAATYGDSNEASFSSNAMQTEDMELQRAIQASLEAQYDEDEMLARAIAESMASSSGFH